MPGARIRGFASRREAGRLLARAVGECPAVIESNDVVVVGLARGGVAVAAEVAKALHAPLDALAVRKVGHPRQPEYGIGAVAPGGIAYVRAHDGLTDAEAAAAVHSAGEQVAILDASLHRIVESMTIARATCVLVDDGLATGGTMIAAVRWARARGAARVVVAVPVGAAATLVRIETTEDVDAVVSLIKPIDFGAVGFWYDDFRQVSDEDVVGLLAASRGNDCSWSTEIGIDGVRLPADLTVPERALGWIVFAHGSGSSRRSTRNVSVAKSLNDVGFATLLFDLLTPEEALDRQNVFDVELLADRLVAATRWLSARSEASGMPIAYFGASTGAAAALLAAVELGDEISAVVSRGGRPDLAWRRLEEVRAPTLLVVGGADKVVLELNEAASDHLSGPHRLAVVRHATHLFEEPGALEEVASLAASWFEEHLAASATADGRRRVAR